jgi:outer membrane lipoprotein-sorting protein
MTRRAPLLACAFAGLLVVPVPARAGDAAVSAPAAGAAEAAATAARLEKALAAVEKATRDVAALQARYLRETTVFGRQSTVLEEGRFWWKRTPQGVVSARWEGKDEKGALLRLLRGKDLSVWRGTKRDERLSVDDPAVLHEARFGFPLLPPSWGAVYLAGPPWTSPDWDDRLPKRLDDGIPGGVTFRPRNPRDHTFKAVSLLFDEKTGVAWRFRCDTNGWQLVMVDLDDVKINPEVPDALFEPPAGAGDLPAPAASAGTAPPRPAAK